MVLPVIGVIGGSGLYDIGGLTDTRWERVESPFGETSDEFLFGELDGLRLVFLPRHGRGHKIPPTELNYTTARNHLNTVMFTALRMIAV